MAIPGFPKVTKITFGVFLFLFGVITIIPNKEDVHTSSLFGIMTAITL
jgi:hypothetical protein